MAQLQSTGITGSLSILSGSNVEFLVTDTGVRIGNIITDTHTVTGSLSISGSLNATSSWATTASSAISASHAATASFAVSASRAITASFALNTGGAAASNLIFSGSVSASVDVTSTQIFKLTSGSSTFMQVNNAGNVGINTTSPLSKLQVNIPLQTEFFGTDVSIIESSLTAYGTGAFRGLGTGSAITFAVPATSSGANIWAQARILGTGDNSSADSAEGAMFLQTRALYNPGVGGSWNWRTNMVLRASGNIGIGTISPTAKLQISGSTDSLVFDAYSSGFNGSYALLPGRTVVGTITGGYPQFGYNFSTNGGVFTKLANDTAWNIALGESNLMQFRYAAAGTGTFSWNTAAVINLSGNVGIGTTSPDAPLRVAGGFNSTQSLFGNTTGRGLAIQTVLVSGTNEAGSVLNARGAGAGTLIFQTEGTERTRIDVNGNVGVGTSSPASRFEIKSSAANNLGGLLLRATSTSNFPAILYENSSNAGTLDLYNAATLTTRIDAGGVTYFSGSGVGIGTTTPSRKLSVYDSSAYMSFNASSARTFTIGSDSSGFLIFDDTAASYRAVINASGNLGIGTTNPGFKLDVIGNARIVTSTIPLYVYSSGSDFTQGIRIGDLSTDNSYMYLAYVSQSKYGSLQAGDNISFRPIAINPIAGNVGIGTTAPAAQLHISGAADIRMTNTANTSGFDIGLLGGSADANAYIYQRANSNIIFGTNNTERGRISSTGQLRLNAYTATSSFSGTVAGFLAFDTNGNILTTGASGSGGGGTSQWTTNGTAIYYNGGSVGIGSTTPRGTLDVTGSGNTIVLGDGTQGGSLYFGANSTANSILYAGGEFQIRTNQSTGLSFYTQGTQKRMVIADNGNVGIGSTAPVAKLEVVGDIASNGGNVRVNLGISTGDAYVDIGANRSGNGYSYIDLIGDATYTDYGFRIIRGNSGANTNTQLIHRGTGPLEIGTTEAGDIGLFTGGGTKVTILSGGNVGIGTTTPGARLEIKRVSSEYPVSINSSHINSASFTQYEINNSGGWEHGMAGLDNSYKYFFSYGAFGPATALFTIQNDGNVGIGTTAPSSAKLVVTTAAAAEGLDLSTADSYANLRVLRNSLSSIDKDMYIGYQSGVASRLHLYSNNVETATISGSRVGIGTITPGALLHVSGTTGGVFEVDGAAAVNALYVSASGAVGIGTTNPLFKLHVSESVNGSSGVRFENSNTGANAFANIQVGSSFALTRYMNMSYGGTGTIVDGAFYPTGSTLANYGNGGLNLFAQGLTGPIRFFTGNGTGALKMIINNGGTVSILNTNSSYALDVNASGVTGARVFSGSFAVGNITPSATVGRIDASNDVVAFSTSDARFKTNVTPISNALEKITQIGGYEFDWIPNQEYHGFEGHDVGIIAQEIEKVLPEVVKERDSGYKAVKYEKIVPLLIEAIKEQQKQIDELKFIISQK